jgi:hypothetical protein
MKPTPQIPWHKTEIPIVLTAVAIIAYAITKAHIDPFAADRATDALDKELNGTNWVRDNNSYETRSEFHRMKWTDAAPTNSEVCK